MTNEEAINIIRNEAECVKRANTCGRNCAECELVKEDTEILAAYQMAVKALQASPTLADVSVIKSEIQRKVEDYKEEEICRNNNGYASYLAHVIDGLQLALYIIDIETKNTHAGR